MRPSTNITASTTPQDSTQTPLAPGGSQQPNGPRPGKRYILSVPTPYSEAEVRERVAGVLHSVQSSQRNAVFSCTGDADLSALVVTSSAQQSNFTCTTIRDTGERTEKEVRKEAVYDILLPVLTTESDSKQGEFYTIPAQGLACPR